MPPFFFQFTSTWDEFSRKFLFMGATGSPHPLAPTPIKSVTGDSHAEALKTAPYKSKIVTQIN
jgi:hypothetical protein